MCTFFICILLSAYFSYCFLGNFVWFGIFLSALVLAQKCQRKNGFCCYFWCTHNFKTEKRTAIFLLFCRDISLFVLYLFVLMLVLFLLSLLCENLPFFWLHSSRLRQFLFTYLCYISCIFTLDDVCSWVRVLRKFWVVFECWFSRYPIKFCLSNLLYLDFVICKNYLLLLLGRAVFIL